MRRCDRSFVLTIPVQTLVGKLVAAMFYAAALTAGL